MKRARRGLRRSGQNMCPSMQSQLSQMFKKSAAVLGFDDNFGKIQTANASANLGFKLGGNDAQVPNFCVSKTEAKNYVVDYALFNEADGKLWVPGAGEAEDKVVFLISPQGTDRVGTAWSANLGANEPQAVNRSSGQVLNPQPSAQFICDGDGENAQIFPAAQKDIDGDGNPDGFFGVNQVPDGTQVIDSYGKKYRIKGTLLLEVPTAKAANQCNGITLKPTVPAPLSLNCGGSNANKNQAAPTKPNKVTWLNGVWKGANRL